MKISGQLNSVNVDLGERPGAVKQDGVWYEATRYGYAKQKEYIYTDGLMQNVCASITAFPCWIMRPIPRATPEQLAVIGVREKYSKPVECKEGDTIWAKLACSDGR